MSEVKNSFKDTENKEKINNLKKSYDINELNTIITVIDVEKKEEQKANELIQIKESHIEKSIFDISIDKSLKKTLVNS